MADAAGDIVASAVSVGLEAVSEVELMAGYCERLVEAGYGAPRSAPRCCIP